MSTAWPTVFTASGDIYFDNCKLTFVKKTIGFLNWNLEVIIMNEISCNDKFESVWCRDNSVEKTPKPLNSQLCTSISLINYMKQYSFKITEPSLNNISKFCQVTDQLLQKNIERCIFFLLVFNYVVFIDFY